MYITFDEFSRMSLRVGQIKEASLHPNADKLYVLKVDLKDKEIQLVAGIRNSYTLEELIGKQIAVLENLEPKMLRGIQSQGMLLAASGQDGPILLVPEKDVLCGCPIK